MRITWMRFGHGWGVAIFAIVLPFLGCSGSGQKCPRGFERVGNNCIPIRDLSPHESVVLPDLVKPEDEVWAIEQVEGAPLPEEGENFSEGAELLYPGGFVGLPCAKDQECRQAADFEYKDSAVCLDWPGGYCTSLGCTKGQCPAGAECLGITPNKPACAQLCSSNADCRPGGSYGCKAVADPEGKLVKVCYQVKKKGATGEGCSGHQDCFGEASCMTSFAGGYCAVLGCDAQNPCLEGTACVLVGGVAACLKKCALDEDCQVPGDLPRSCAKVKSATVYGEKHSVCVSGTLGVPLGGQCMNDLDCATEVCEVVATGKCSNSSKGCKSDQDCEGFGEICLQSAADTLGFCTKQCSSAVPCPGQSFCVGTKINMAGQIEGFCMAGCQEPGDLTCRQEVGLSCVFGDPVNAFGRYACARLSKGSPGALCSSNSDCLAGTCLAAQAGGGYCLSPCGTFAFCPFPTSCQTVSGQPGCFRRCSKDLDCPTGHKCTRPPGALLEICYPGP